MKPIYLKSGECATVYLDNHDQDCLTQLNNKPQPTKKGIQEQKTQDSLRIVPHVHPETATKRNLTRVGTPARQPSTRVRQPTELEEKHAHVTGGRGMHDTAEQPTTPQRTTETPLGSHFMYGSA
jgi:hypothetical protein